MLNYYLVLLVSIFEMTGLRREPHVRLIDTWTNSSTKPALENIVVTNLA